MVIPPILAAESKSIVSSPGLRGSGDLCRQTPSPSFPPPLTSTRITEFLSRHRSSHSHTTCTQHSEQGIVLNSTFSSPIYRHSRDSSLWAQATFFFPLAIHPLRPNSGSLPTPPRKHLSSPSTVDRPTQPPPDPSSLQSPWMRSPRNTMSLCLAQVLPSVSSLVYSASRARRSSTLTAMTTTAGKLPSPQVSVFPT